VFAAGIALRQVADASRGGRATPATPPAHEGATHSEHAGAFLTNAVGSFNAQLERFAELGVVIALGAMLPFAQLDARIALFLALLFVVVRPVAVTLGLLGAEVPGRERALMSWFGIRGIGTIYYLTYAIDHGLPRALADQLTGVALTVVAVSIVVHGVSVTPLMALHAARKSGRPAVG
jgi:NhaP-type Na+/H+ or K+/H+ antiporter